MKIRFDGSSFLEVDSPSGVGHYSRLFHQALSKENDIELTTGPFFRSTDPSTRPNNLQTFLNKSYRKLVSYGLPIPFDIFMPKVDLTVFPNFLRLPNIRSKIDATTVHDLTYLYFPDLVEAKNLSHLEKVIPVALRESDIVMTVSESVKNELVKEFSIPADKVVVTHVPVDPIYTNTPDTKAVSKYNLPNNYILFIGNLEPRKNLSTLIKAYQLLPRDLQDKYHLVIAGGKGWKTQETETVISQAIESGANIQQLGYIDQVDAPTIYRHSSLLALPSLYEGFGMQIMEAFATNTPVVASDIPVFREVANGGATLVNPKDTEGFAEAIKQSLTDKQYVDSLTKPARRQLVSISWDKNSTNLTSKAHELLRSSS